MPKCAKCQKWTFDGTPWYSETKNTEFNRKYLCSACSTELKTGVKSELTEKGTISELCSRCGKKLGFTEKFPVVGVVASKYPIYAGRRICDKCRNELQYAPMDSINVRAPVITELDPDINKAITWQKEEVLADHFKCQEFIEDSSERFGGRVGHLGILVVTNQRVLFVCKVEVLASYYTLMYSINLEDIITVHNGSFGLNNKLIIVNKNGNHKDFLAAGIQAIKLSIERVGNERKQQIQIAKQKERVQVILDFSSLKEVLSNGGIVMTTYKCPNCGGMLNLPEVGKVLMCQYCGVPIKPVDIFDKIKSLIQ